MTRAAAAVGALLIDDRQIEFQAFDTIASCAMRAGVLGLRTSLRGDARGVFCGIGVCNECLVTVDGQPSQRACFVEAIPGIVVRTNRA